MKRIRVQLNCSRKLALITPLTPAVQMALPLLETLTHSNVILTRTAMGIHEMHGFVQRLVPRLNWMKTETLSRGHSFQEQGTI